MHINSVIAITVLGGHAFGSWRSRVSTTRSIDRPVWLRDFLPQKFPDARIMTYGYGSSLKEPTGANITDYLRGFIQCLRKCRRQGPVSPFPTKLHLTCSPLPCCTETSPCLYRAQFGGDPGGSGKRTSPKLNSEGG